MGGGEDSRTGAPKGPIRPLRTDGVRATVHTNHQILASEMNGSSPAYARDMPLPKLFDPQKLFHKLDGSKTKNNIRTSFNRRYSPREMFRLKQS